MALAREDSNWDQDRGSTGGHERMTLTCHDCGWRVSDLSAIAAVSAAQRHHDETGHAISYRGTVQTAWTRTRAVA